MDPEHEALSPRAITPVPRARLAAGLALVLLMPAPAPARDATGSGSSPPRWLAQAPSAPRPPVGDASPLAGDKAVLVRTRDGRSQRIGTVGFREVGPGQLAFRVQMDPKVLHDHFLSMREFKCLPGEVELSCFVPYPYAQTGTVVGDDFTWLEHHLMFFFKRPSEFGARLWNGMIFRLRRDGRGLVGIPEAVDLDRIGVPPERPDQPPFGAAERQPYPSGARWITELRIE